MGFFRDLEKTHSGTLFLYLITTYSLLLPGIAVIYFFHLELLKELDVLKIIFLALLFSFPLFSINMISSSISTEINLLKKERKGEKKEEVDTLVELSVSGILTLTFFFTGLFIAYLLSISEIMSFIIATKILPYALSLVMLLSSIILYYSTKK